jgi:guanylate kinase
VAGILFIISAPSGSGKSTLVSELRKQVSGVDFAISWTTRAPRGSEENGREYNFTTREEFQRMLDAGVFPGARRGLRQLLRHRAPVAR